MLIKKLHMNNWLPFRILLPVVMHLFCKELTGGSLREEGWDCLWPVAGNESSGVMTLETSLAANCNVWRIANTFIKIWDPGNLIGFLYQGHWIKRLTHWGRNKIAAISQTTLWNAFSLMKMHNFRLKFHWSLFLRFELTIFQHWFRYWLGTDQATSHYLNQWWLVYWHIYVSLDLNGLNWKWYLIILEIIAAILLLDDIRISSGVILSFASIRHQSFWNWMLTNNET